MSIPKTDRIIIKPRSETERVAITLEYLASFIVWTEKLTEGEFKTLGLKIQNLVHPSNTQGLNNFLEDCVKYLSAEASTDPDYNFDGAGTFLTFPSGEEAEDETEG